MFNCDYLVMNIKPIALLTALPLIFLLPSLSYSEKAFSMPPAKNQAKKKPVAKKKLRFSVEKGQGYSDTPHLPEEDKGMHPKRLQLSNKKDHGYSDTPKLTSRPPAPKKLRFSDKKNTSNSHSPKPQYPIFCPNAPRPQTRSVAKRLLCSGQGFPTPAKQIAFSDSEESSFTAKPHGSSRQRESFTTSTPKPLSETKVVREEYKSQQLTSHQKTATKRKTRQKPAVFVVSQETLQEIHKRRARDADFMMSPIEYSDDSSINQSITEHLASLGLYTPPYQPTLSSWLEGIDCFHEFLYQNNKRKKRFEIPFTHELEEAGSNLESLEILKIWAVNHYKLQGIIQKLKQDPDTSGVSLRIGANFLISHSETMIEDSIQLWALWSGIENIKNRAQQATERAVEREDQLLDRIKDQVTKSKTFSANKASKIYLNAYSAYRNIVEKLYEWDMAIIQSDTIQSLLEFLVFNRLLSELELIKGQYNDYLARNLHHKHQKDLRSFSQRVSLAQVIMGDCLTKESQEELEKKIKEVQELIETTPRAVSTPKEFTTGDKKVTITYKGKKKKLLKRTVLLLR